MGFLHRVNQGEYLSSIARKYGFADWRRIYDHPENERLRKRRANPNVILPGDEVLIPRESRQEEIASGRTHKFVVRLPPPDRLVLVLTDDSGKPLAGEPYRLGVEGTEIKGRTADDGTLDVELPPGAASAVLVLDNRPSRPRRLAIGHLDPVYDGEKGRGILSGVKARLQNLGYDCHGASGETLDDVTRRALRAFQRDVLGRQDVDGYPDEATCVALLDRHRS